MKQSIRGALILILFCATLFAINEYMKTAYLHQLKQDVQARFTVIKSFIVGDDLHVNQNENRLRNISKKTDGKLTLYNTNGQILLTTSDRPLPLDNLKTHQSSAFITNDYFVYWRPLHSSANGQLLGYGVLAVPSPSFSGLHILDIFLFISGIILIFFYQRLKNRFQTTIEKATEMAEALALGNYKVRTSESSPVKGVLDLNYSLNVLARNLEKMTKSYQSQQDRLRTLIENIGSGLIFIDSSGQINLVNKTYRETFHLQTELWNNEDYGAVIPQHEVVALIDETFLTEQPINRQLKLPIRIERRHFDVSCAPVLNHNNRLRGILVVFHDITELKKLEQMRRDFVANVSHELKTPITSITGFSETLLDGAMEDSDLATKFLTIIHKESVRLQTLIHDLLDLSKIEGDRFEIEKAPVLLQELVEDTLLILQDKAQNKDIDVTLTKSDTVYALGDTYRIRQVLINLINNAIAYTAAGGSVTLQVEETPENAKMIVADTGIGMDDDELPRIFERFYRVDKARSRNSGGTGLGLAIVKHLVEAHDGEILVESQKGIGTTFTILLPKAVSENP